MQNPRRHFIFSRLLKLDKLEGMFQNGNFGFFFFIIMIEHSF